MTQTTSQLYGNPLTYSAARHVSRDTLSSLVTQMILGAPPRGTPRWRDVTQMHGERSNR